VMLVWCEPALSDDLGDAVKSSNVGKASAIVSARDKDNPLLALSLNRGGPPYLISAVRSGRKEMVEFVLSKKMGDVKDKDENGDTPLHIAAMMGRADIEKLLIDNGANVNARDKRGETPLTK